MKIYAVVAGVLIFWVGLGFYTIDRFQGNATQMLDEIGRTETAIFAARWDEAAASIDNIKRAWEKHQRWWNVFIDHDEIDNIDTALTRTEQYVKARERVLATGELAVLKLMLEHIPEKERVSLKNIF